MVALSISNFLFGLPGTTVPVDISIDDATGLQSADITLSYDTSILDLVVNDAEGNSPSVTLGSLTAGWTDTVNIDEANGAVTLSLFNAQTLAGGSGSLAQLSFQIRPDAPLESISNLDIVTAGLGINGQDVVGGISLNDGSLTVGDSFSINLDVDGSGAASFARDGLLISGFLFFNRPDRTDFAPLNRFILDSAATRRTGNDVADYIKSGLDALDVDGSGAITFARDGLLINAFLFFYRPDRTDYSILDRFVLDSAATRRTGNEIADYLRTLLPSSTSGLAADASDIAPATDIIGTASNDTLVGDLGNNTLFGEAGDDLLTGGLGADTFKFTTDSGNDVVTDFTVGEDLIAVESILGFSNGSEVFAAITAKGMVEGQFSSELDLGANGKIAILHDEALTADNFVVI
jgi:Ca2+-binding RTX toxin-like protein